METSFSWNYYFLHIAKSVKIKSCCHKVGAILVSEDNIIKGTGFNSLPGNLESTIDLKNPKIAELYICDAEINCLVNSDPTTDYSSSVIYTTCSPKAETIKTIASFRIKKIYYDECRKDIDLTRELCRFFTIDLVKYIPRDTLRVE